MSKHENFDIIIAGAGASGLSLLKVLLASSYGKKCRILLIDRRLNPSADKTWCFWSDKTGVQNLTKHSWNSLEVRFEGLIHETTLKKYAYHCVRSEDFTRSVLELADKADNVTFLEADISDFSCINPRGLVYTSEGVFSASWIFQSVLRPEKLQNARMDNSLIQHFTGWEIHTNQPVFHPDKVTLMDFDTPQQSGVTFFYVLPFSEKEALIEYTVFSGSLLSEEVYENNIRAYLLGRYDMGSDDYKIVRKEKGEIPMEDRRYPAWYSQRVLNIGTMGGITKPSSGYAFSRIQRHSEDIVTALKRGATPPVSNRSAYRFRVYDLLFLNLMANQPDTAVRIFENLFQNNEADRILQFLDEDTRFREELKIFASVPPVPFLKSIYKMKHRIITGA